MGVQLSQNYHLQRCEPGIAQGALTYEPAFGGHVRRPVSAEFDADGEVSSPCLSFDDYSRMQTIHRTTTGHRKVATPTWAVNHSELRELIVRFFEMRAGMRKPGDGSLIQRLNAAQQRLMARLPRNIEILDRLMREYRDVRSTDPARAKVLETQIQNLDTVIRTTREGPGLIARLVYLFYCCGQDSVGTAAELGLRPQHVRRTLFGLHRVAEGKSRKDHQSRRTPRKIPNA
jgi:hypothetical protein